MTYSHFVRFSVSLIQFQFSTHHVILTSLVSCLPSLPFVFIVQEVDVVQLHERGAAQGLRPALHPVQVPPGRPEEQVCPLLHVPRHEGGRPGGHALARPHDGALAAGKADQGFNGKGKGTRFQVEDASCLDTLSVVTLQMFNRTLP